MTLFASVNGFFDETIVALDPAAENQLAAARCHDGHLVDVVAAATAKDVAIVSTLANTIHRP